MKRRQREGYTTTKKKGRARERDRNKQKQRQRQRKRKRQRQRTITRPRKNKGKKTKTRSARSDAQIGLREPKPLPKGSRMRPWSSNPTPPHIHQRAPKVTPKGPQRLKRRPQFGIRVYREDCSKALANNVYKGIHGFAL